MMATMHYLYILKSTTADKFYIGSSEIPERRLFFHNNVETGFTARYRPWELVYAQEFATKEEAMAAERKLKSWKSKSMVLRVINGETKL